MNRLHIMKLMEEYDQTDDFYRSEIDSQRMRNENMFMGAKEW